MRLLTGLAGAAMAAVLVFGVFVPGGFHLVRGSLATLDADLETRATYMRALCIPPWDARDEGLCMCVLSSEAPALDCVDPFRGWALARQEEACADSSTHAHALRFCTCIETVAATLRTPNEDDKVQRITRVAYDRCALLEDALPLPTVDAPL